MRHGKHTFKIGRTSSHRRGLVANLLKSLIEHERIETSLAKAKELRRHADRMITLAKKQTLASRRRAIAKLMVSHNPLASKEARAVKKGEKKTNHPDVIDKLFTDLGPRFVKREGGYTRIIKMSSRRTGDGGQRCLIEYLPE